MKKSGILILLLNGVVFSILGLNATNSFLSDLSRFFTRSGSSNDNAIWMFLGGSTAAIAGLVLALRHWRQWREA